MDTESTAQPLDTQREERYRREAAVNLALAGGAKFDSKTIANAETIYAFITAGNAAAPSAKPATSGAKPKPDDAPSTSSTAPEPSSGKPAVTEKPSETKTSPSNDADGFDRDGVVITKDEFRAACIKFVESAGATGQDQLRKVFTEFGITGAISTVPATQYGDIIAKLNGNASVAAGDDTDSLFG